MRASLAITISFALALAGLLQGNDAAGQQPAAPAAPAVSIGQATTPGAEATLATILQSGSTNSRAYKVAIHNDGSAAVEFEDPVPVPAASNPNSFLPEPSTLRRFAGSSQTLAMSAKLRPAAAQSRLHLERALRSAIPAKPAEICSAFCTNPWAAIRCCCTHLKIWAVLCKAYWRN